MPKEIKDLKLFMQHLVGEQKEVEAQEGEHKPTTQFKKKLTVKRNKRITKFKLRTKRYLYTYKTADGKVIKKILNNLPSNVAKTEIKRKRVPK